MKTLPGHTKKCSLLACGPALLTTAAVATGQSTLYSIDGDAGHVRFGSSIDAAGDVNGDGVPDWIAGAPDSYARVYSGSDGAVIHDFPAPAVNTFFGRPVAGAGDVDLDGHPDLLVGAEIDSTSFHAAGRVWLFSGRDGSVIRTHEGAARLEFSGAGLAGLGDVDGDGHSDYAIGAPGGNEVRVFSGLDGSLVFRVSNGGRAVAAAGDVDADGVVDLIVGNRWDEGTGSARVYSGASGLELYEVFGDFALGRFGAEVAGVGDLDGDGHVEFAVGAPRENRPPSVFEVGVVRVYSGASGAMMYAFSGDKEWDGFGRSIDSAGDVDADGVPDVLVGAPTNTDGGGFAGIPETQEPLYARVYSGADGSPLYTYRGEFEHDRFGFDVAGIGDVDADGYDDLAVAAPLDDHVGVNSGRVRVLGGVGCPQPVSYCVTSSARIGSSGSVNLSQDELLLWVVEGVPDQFGFFFHGPEAIQVPAGDGVLCVGGSIERLPVVSTNFAGIVIFDLAPLVPGLFAPGQTVRFQYVFRDPLGPGGSGFNYSDALVATFCP